MQIQKRLNSYRKMVSYAVAPACKQIYGLKSIVAAPKASFNQSWFESMLTLDVIEVELKLFFGPHKP